MIRSREFLLRIRESFWFVPALGMAGGLCLAVAMIEVDARAAFDLGRQWPRLFGAGAEAGDPHLPEGLAVGVT